MKLEEINVTPMGLSFEPEFHITIEYSYRQDCKLPLRFNGYLFLDRYRIAFLHEYEFNHGREDHFTARSSNQNIENKDKRIFIAPITRQVLSKLEDKRSKDPKGDLKFDLHLNITFFEPQFDKSICNDGEGDLTVATIINDAIFKLRSYDFAQEIKISSGDWLHDFSPVFQRGRFQVFELQVPNGLTDTTDLSNRLNAAIVSLREMETSKSDGDWNGVIKETRPVWELVKNKEEITDLLKNDEMHQVTIESFKRLIDSLFDFSSKFIHKESKNKEIMTLNKASKEDAELVYALSVSLVNLITKKISK
jgi:hypothetical protein